MLVLILSIEIHKTVITMRRTLTNFTNARYMRWYILRGKYLIDNGRKTKQLAKNTCH